MTWVKVCGLTREDDVAAAVAAGADAVGFIIAPESPRCVAIDRAAALAASATVTRVLVTVDLEPEPLLEAADRCGVDAVQPHGRHAPDAARVALEAGLRVLLPVPVRDPFVIPPIPEGALPLFDTADPAVHGGTGKSFDWARVSGVDRPFVLAGGLGPDNVASAVRAVRPYGVDASSRLEAAIGVKDHGKVTAFVREAKSA